MNPDCTRPLDGLKRTLEAGTDLDPEARAHLQGCATCRASLGAALKCLEADDRPAPAVDSRVVEAEVLLRHRRNELRRRLVVGAVLAATCFGLLASRGAIQDATVVLGLAVLALILGTILAFWLVRTPARSGLFKRLGPGRQLSGVCLGLAQRTGTPAWAWRLGFVLLAVLPATGHLGLWLYVLLDLAMPVHPEDRPNLLRFRLARWWRTLRTRSA
jgi:phage shock protein PspC (stress-responsive transcriptional regulator)